MRKVLIGIILVALGSSLGLGAAFGVGLLARRTPSTTGPGVVSLFGWNSSGQTGPGMMGGYSWGGAGGRGPGMMGGSVPGGMMGNWGWGTGSATGQRLSMDQVITQAIQYAASSGQNLEVAEVMEFSSNFYAAILEKDTGRGAFEILLDPYSGAISAEPGPNMMWNAKYGRMGGWAGGDNTLTLAQAQDLAQKALDANQLGAKVHQDARAFYGYYTFDYDFNRQTAGMLSVNGTSGQVWPHTWHGQFVAEKEISK
jgi:hypothetical protein